MVKDLYKKISLVFLGIFLAFVVIEIFLRISGLIFISFQRVDNTIDDAGGSYRILALGESTTANLHNGQSTWPDQLEIILNRNSGTEFKVFNEGIPGITSSTILENLEGNLERYNPDMVITMMGTNDEGLLVSKSALINQFKSLRTYKLIIFLIEALKNKPDNEKTTKLSENEQIKGESEKLYYEEEKRLMEAVKKDPKNLDQLHELAEFYEKNEKYEELANVVIRRLELGPVSSKAHVEIGKLFIKLERYKEAEEMLEKALEADADDSLAYAKLGNVYAKLNKTEQAIKMYNIYKDHLRSQNGYDEALYIKLADLYLKMNDSRAAYDLLKVVIYLNPEKRREALIIGKLYPALNKTDDAIKLFQRTVTMNPSNYEAFSELAWHYLNSNQLDKAQKIFGKVREINPLYLMRVYENIGIRYKEDGNSEESERMFKMMLKLREGYFNPVTQKNYVELYNVLKKRGVKLIVMQYPTLDVKELKNFFSGNGDIIFVSNEENFKNSLENSSYDEIFIDNVRGSFGHATLKGNKLIAENLAETISKS